MCVTRPYNRQLEHGRHLNGRQVVSGGRAGVAKGAQNEAGGANLGLVADWGQLFGQGLDGGHDVLVQRALLIMEAVVTDPRTNSQVSNSQQD